MERERQRWPSKGKKIDWEKIGNDYEGFIGGLFLNAWAQKKDRERFNIYCKLL